MKVNVADRLHSHHTLNSIRRDSRIIRPKEPEDALDYALSSIYIHSDDSMVPKMYVPMQAESLNRNTWRQLRNELKPSAKRGIGSMTSSARERKISMSPTAKGGIGSMQSSAKDGKRSTPPTPKTRQNNYSDGLPFNRNDSSTSPVTINSKKGMTTGSSMEHSCQRDNILNKNQRHATYASQMRAIERIHRSSLKLAIEGPHADQTNPGYSRKIDGTFYSV